MWTNIIETKVFTRLQQEVRKRLKDDFPKITCTTENASDKQPTFPSVYLRQLQGYPPTKGGYSLDSAEVNGTTSSFQITCTDNEERDNARHIGDVVSDIMSEMGYFIIGEPVTEKTGGVWENVARYQRVIGYNDKF